MPKAGKEVTARPLSQLCYVTEKAAGARLGFGGRLCPLSDSVKERTMSATKIIWFAVLVVFGVVTAVGTEAPRNSGPAFG